MHARRLARDKSGCESATPKHRMNPIFFLYLEKEMERNPKPKLGWVLEGFPGGRDWGRKKSRMDFLRHILTWSGADSCLAARLRRLFLGTMGFSWRGKREEDEESKKGDEMNGSRGGVCSLTSRSKPPGMECGVASVHSCVTEVRFGTGHIFLYFYIGVVSNTL
jgi:hypothetical protein